MAVYTDTNFLTALYLPLDDGQATLALLEKARANGQLPLPVTWLLRLELTNAFEQSVFMARTTGQARVTPEMASAAHASFRDDLLAGSVWKHEEIDMDVLIKQFETLALRHTARHGFRTYDLLHVASAITLGCNVFWTFDQRAKHLARLEGLEVN